MKITKNNLIEMKKALQIVFLLLSIFFAYKIYQSINQPIQFEKVKQERYAEVIDKLKDIRDTQEAYKTVTGRFANDFPSLIKFVDTAQFTITQQRDSSYMEYNETYRIEMLKEVKIIDTLGFVPVKDSLFGNDNRYKTMMNVPFPKDKDKKFTLQAKIIDKNGFKIPVFEAKVAKNIILHDQPEYLLKQENEVISVDDVNGSEIIVGSLENVSTNGNWPTIYDTKKDN